jgi:hypothetical protein
MDVCYDCGEKATRVFAHVPLPNISDFYCDVDGAYQDKYGDRTIAIEEA